MYTIKVNYNTGNSFGSHEEEKVLTDLDCESIEVVNDNLRRIKEHYEAYKEDRYNYKTKKTQEDWFKCDWHPKEWLSHGDFPHCVRLTADNGVEFNFYCDWLGYFERLNWCEVITTPIEGMRYDF
jgi:hypothetical protein